MVRSLRDGKLVLILMVGRTMSITIHTALHGFALPRTKLSIIKLRRARLIRPARVVCLPDGRSDALRMGDSTMWITTPSQPTGWIHDIRSLSVSWVRTARVLCSVRLSRNSVRCRLGGKCESILRGGSTSLITTPGPQHGTIHSCRRLMKAGLSTCAISVRSRSTSVHDRRCVPSLEIARSKSGATTYLRIAMPKLCARRLTILKGDL
jgi:hypothetical protein